MTTMVGDSVSARALQRARRRRNVSAQRTLQSAAPLAQKAPAQQRQLTQQAKIERSPEYSPLDPTDVVGGIADGVTGDMIRPIIKSIVADIFDPSSMPWVGSDLGKVVPGKIAGLVTGEIAGLVGGPVSDLLRGLLHGKVASVGEPQPGIGASVSPPNKLLAKLTKGIATSWMDMWIKQALAPPPPPPPPPPGAETVPRAQPPVATTPPLPAPPVAPTPTKVLGKELGPILHDANMGLISMGISAFYDQAVGPLVQRGFNVLTGKASEEVAKPAPLTPGTVARRYVGKVLSSLLVRGVSYPSAPGVSIPFAGSLGESISNAVIDAAWGTVFDRGIGGAIQGAVDGAAGIVPKEEQAKAKLPVGEHVLRAGTRAAAVGATTYLLGNALNPIMVQLGTSLGGVGGALVAMAGAALIGSVGASVVDATVGAKLGQFGGSLYSWITGRDNFEARAAKQAAVGSTTPADSTTPAGSATPTTSVAHTPASPQRAPIAGAPRRRRTTGQQAVDRTSPAILLTPARLAQIAAAG